MEISGLTFISSVQLHLTLCDPIDCSTPVLPVHHQLLELTETHVQGVSDAIQPSHPLSFPSPAFNLSQHQGLYKCQFFASCGQSTGVSASALVFPTNIQDWFPLGWTGWSPCSPRNSQVSSPTPQFKSINSLALIFLYSPTLISIHDYWKKHSLARQTLVGKAMSLLFNTLSSLVITFLPRRKNQGFQGERKSLFISRPLVLILFSFWSLILFLSLLREYPFQFSLDK